jgi:GTPase SAR1 family protein
MKGLIGRPSDKIHWATTLLEHTDVLQAYEAGLQEELEDPHPYQPNRQQQEQTRIPTPPGQTPANQTKGKDKMPTMTRQTPDPLKQMRQKQAADAKQLAAENMKREGLRKEQEK